MYLNVSDAKRRLQVFNARLTLSRIDREKLQTSLARFFQRLPVDKPVLRNNYFFQIVRPADDPDRQASIDPDELAWSDTTNGDEDHFEQKTKEPTLEAQESGEVQFQPPKPTDSVENIRLRTERQSLRRLPRTGAIVFTIRTYIFPITELSQEPGVPGRMASGIRSWPDDVSLYDYYFPPVSANHRI